jgi:predicted HAD superfamily Cof-like phosphohydrolase
MKSVFEQQREFMQACGQTTWTPNDKQILMYESLIEEEHAEWLDAYGGKVDDLDAVIDQIVVLIGYGLSHGWDMEGAWAEVMRSNMAKIDPDTGMVRRRADGKILKPGNWVAPDLKPFMEPSKR